MNAIAIKLTSSEAIRAACELSIAQGEQQAQVMYKSEHFDDDDYVGADLEEFAQVKNDPAEFIEFCGGGRHSWELWVYEKQEARTVEAGEATGGNTSQPVPDSHEALLMAASYIQYVKERNPELHEEADGTPSIEQVVAKAIGSAA